MNERKSRIILQQGGQVLMARDHSGRITFLGDHIEEGETAVEAAIRVVEGDANMKIGHHTSNLVELPSQDSDPELLWHWFSIDIPPEEEINVEPRGNVVELFWITLEQVEHYVTYEDWKHHWTKCLLPALLSIT